MAKCNVVNQHCTAPANARGSTSSVCFACGHPVCTAAGCSIRTDYLTFGEQRVCYDCLTDRFGEAPGISAGLLNLCIQWVKASGYKADASHPDVIRLMKEPRDEFARKMRRRTPLWQANRIKVGDYLYGSCGDRFIGGTRSDDSVKRVEGLGSDWVVLRAAHGESWTYQGDLSVLLPYVLPKGEHQHAVIATELGAVGLEYINGKSGMFWRGCDEDGARLEVYP